MPHPKFIDATYAGILNALPENKLPTRSDVLPGVEDGRTVQVPIGKYLDRLREKGCTDPEPGLIDALARHGQSFYYDGKKERFRLEPTGKRMNWTDADYAAALNARDPGDLPDRSVPLGNALYNMRYRGRKRPPEQVLVDALARHGLKPEQGDAGKWKLPYVRGQAASSVAGHSPAAGQGPAPQEVASAQEFGTGAGPSSAFEEQRHSPHDDGVQSGPGSPWGESIQYPPSDQDDYGRSPFGPEAFPPQVAVSSYALPRGWNQTEAVVAGPAQQQSTSSIPPDNPYSQHLKTLAAGQASASHRSSTRTSGSTVPSSRHATQPSKPSTSSRRGAKPKSSRPGH
ncbi:hypothetical protein [Streptomyces niveus]